MAPIMKRLLLGSLGLLLATPACVGGDRSDTGQCPAGETCSPETPSGLQFIGSSLLGAFVVGGPLGTAIGGTQEVELDIEAAIGVYVPLNLAYTVDDDGGAGVRFDHQNGNIVTVRGAGSSSNYLRILDATSGDLFDRKMLTGAQIDTIALVPATLDEIPTGMQVAYAAGLVDVGVALLDANGERLVDTSMVATLDGATQRAWDTLELANASPGDSALSVTAGDSSTAQLTVSIVDGADAMTEIDPASTIAPGDDICFAATNAGRFVAGLAWSFTINGVPTAGTANCVSGDQPSGTMTVIASAGGQTATVEMTVVQSAVRHASHRPQALPTAGDRAAM